MDKLDLRKKWKYLYAPSAKEVHVVDVPAFNFVMIDGQFGAGETPETAQAFQDALGALYGVSYTAKFASKLRATDPIDYTVMALEGLWWTDLGAFDFDKKEGWSWTLMMMQPEHITAEMFRQALRQVAEKRPNPALSQVRFERFHEGLAMQIMHVGPYAEEPRTLERMRLFAAENGYALRGRHHEIYLGDPRRAKPERLKTVLRHPLQKIG